MCLSVSILSEIGEPRDEAKYVKIGVFFRDGARL